MNDLCSHLSVVYSPPALPRGDASDQAKYSTMLKMQLLRLMIVNVWPRLLRFGIKPDDGISHYKGENLPTFYKNLIQLTRTDFPMRRGYGPKSMELLKIVLNQVTDNQRLFIVSSMIHRTRNEKAKLSRFIILCNTRETIKRS